MASLVRTVNADAEPVTLTDAKLWCRIDNTAEDSVISSLITAAREKVEADTDRQFAPQTWVWTVDQRFRLPKISDAVIPDLHWGDAGEGWGEAEWPWFLWGRRYPSLRSPVTPVQSVLSITYRSNGADASYDMTNFRVGGDRDLIFGDGLPISDEQKDAITITMVCGLTTEQAVTALEERYRQAIRMLVVHWYENRVPVQMGTGRGIVEIPLGYRELIGGARSWSL